MPERPMWRRHERIDGENHPRDVDEEFAFHMEERVERLRREGYSDEAARVEAIRRFGHLQRARANYIAMATRRSARQAIATVVESWVADARYAVRVFRRSPAFAVTVVLVAALGIAVNTTVFAALNALFLRPLPVPRPHEMVRVYTSNSGSGGAYGGNSYPDYLNLRQAPSLHGLAAYVPLSTTIRTRTAALRAEGRLVSENFFTVLDVHPAAGRLFRARDAPADNAEVVLGHAFWRRHFAADPRVVGSAVHVNGAPAVIVGVLEDEFTGIEPGHVDLYVPVGAHRLVAPGFGFEDSRGARLVKLVGRLAPGATASRAASDLHVIMQGLGQTYPDSNAGRTITVTRAAALIDIAATRVPLGPVVTLIFSITGVLLLIATVNIAGLVLARTVARRRELAVRLSLGASRLRLVRQLVVEGLVLGAVAEGVALALLSLLPLVARAFQLPESVHVGVDARVLAFASTLAMVTALGFSIGPAVKGSVRNPFSGLRDSQATMPRARGQRTLVVVQVTLSIVLLSAAMLLTQSVRRQYTVDPGFATSHLLAAEFEFDRGIATRDEARAFADALVREVRQIPGVEVASVTSSPPLTSEGARMSIDIPGFRSADGRALEIPFSPVGPDYAASLGLRIVAGQELRSRNTNAAAPRRGILVNETVARTYWPGRTPVGAMVRLGNSGGPALTVLGVVADARMVSLSRPAGPHFYLQTDAVEGPALLVRTTAAAEGLRPVLERAFSSGRAGYSLRRLRTMEEIMGASLAEARALASVTGAISVLALVLAVSALYGLVSYLTAQRTREFGIRLALGATPGDVRALVLSAGIRLTATGVVAGFVLSVAVAAALQALIFAVSPLDLATLVAVAAAAGAVSVGACLVPASRASAIQPAATLRAE